jgi:hypothetical protein
LVPLPSSYPERLDLGRGKRSFHELGQCAGLRDTYEDRKPATGAAPQSTAWNNAVILEQPVESACNGFVQRSIKGFDEALFRSHRETVTDWSSFIGPCLFLGKQLSSVHVNFDGLVPKMPFSVIPAKAGIQSFQALLDSRLRGSDDCGDFLRGHQL